jgi:hypothetical protein
MLVDFLSPVRQSLFSSTVEHILQHLQQSITEITNHKSHTNKMHYIFTFYSLTPTYVSTLTRPSSGGS